MIRVTPWDCWPRAFDDWEIAMAEETARVNAYNAAFQAQWPSYCRTCGGNGGFGYYDNHGLGGIGEHCFDECADCLCADPIRCPRCGAANTLNADTAEGPCTSCQWNFDDGIEQ
jgi:hypothetical protein